MSPALNIIIRSDGLEPLARAYKNTVRLGMDEARRLSNFLRDLRLENIRPVWMVLGRSEFLSRTGSTYRAVIGGDGTVSGTVTDNATGMGFGGASHVEFDNPLPNPASEFSVWCSASAASDHLGVLVGSYGASGARGPALSIGYATGGSAPALGAFTSGVVVAGNGITRLDRNHPTNGLFADQKRLYGLNFSGTYAHGEGSAPVATVRDTDSVNSGASAIVEVYNGNTKWRLARRTDGFSPLTGEIDFAMICSHPLTRPQRARLLYSGHANRIWSVPTPRLLIAIGDSMTAGVTGDATATNARTPQLTYYQTSGWQGGYYTERAVSGQDITAQEGYYAEMKYIFDTLKSFDRYVMFWGGYNSVDPGSSTAAVREALVDRYIAMGLDAKSRGVQSIHWSMLIGEGTPSPDDVNIGLFNDYYATQCALHGFIWYDHRTNYPTEFDGATREPTYFSDSRHLTLLGQQVLVADFISHFPNPVPLP